MEKREEKFSRFCCASPFAAITVRAGGENGGVCGEPEFHAEWRRAGAMNGVTVDRQPMAELPQRVLCFIGNHALRVRPDMKQVISTFADDVHEIEGKLLAALPGMITGGISPTIIERPTGFPVAGLNGGGDEIVADRVVVAPIALSHTTANDALRLKLMHELFEGRGAIHGHGAGGMVKVGDRDGAIMGEEFAELREGLCKKIAVEHFGRLVGKIPVVADGVRFAPIFRLGIVEAESHILFSRMHRKALSADLDETAWRRRC